MSFIDIFNVFGQLWLMSIKEENKEISFDKIFLTQKYFFIIKSKIKIKIF